MKCGCGTEKGLILQIKVYKESKRYYGGIVDNGWDDGIERENENINMCYDCFLKMNQEDLQESIANIFGVTLYP